MTSQIIRVAVISSILLFSSLCSQQGVSKGIRNVQNIKDWLSLYNLLSDDYFLKKHHIQHRHFLPRTYFYIPQSISDLNMTGFEEPAFNQDFFTNSKLDENGTYIYRSNYFANPQFAKMQKNEEGIQKIRKYAEEKNQIVMIQKYVEDEISLSENEETKLFVNCKYINGQLFTDLNITSIQSNPFIKKNNQAFQLIERIIAIQQYMSKLLLIGDRENENQDLKNTRNGILTLQLGFTKYKNNIKPFLKNVLPMMDYTTTQYNQDLDSNILNEISLKTVYCKNDRHFKLFKYDYDYRVKRVHIWCNREFVFYHQYYALHTDQFEVPPPHCRNVTLTKEEKQLSLKQSDIVYRRYISRELYFKKNVTQISYLPNSWVIDLKNTFAFFIREFDNQNIVKNYKGLIQIPETYEINLSASYVNEEESLFFYNRTGVMWISKPIHMVGGKGIEIHRNNDEIVRKLLHLKSISNFRNRLELKGLLMYWKTPWVTLLQRKVVRENFLQHSKFIAIIEILKQKKEDEEDVEKYLEALKTNTTNSVIKKLSNLEIKEEKIIIQKYIQNPLLLHKRKFDLRSYVIIVSADPYIVFFRHGYVRLTYNQYDNDDEDLMTHLVNTHIQKKHPQYLIDKDDSHWNMDKFEQVMREEHKIRLSQIEERLYKKMKEMLTYIFLGSKDMIGRKEGLFQIFGTDYMFDEDLNPYLIEINDFPWLQGGTSTHEEVCKETVFEFIELSQYANSKVVKGEQIDVKTLKQKCPKCETLINEIEDFDILQDYM